MKQRLLLMIVALLAGVQAWAYDFVVDGIYYDITSSTDLTVSVVGHSSKKSSGAIVIPESVTRTFYNGERYTYSVTSISYAFSGCSGLTSVVIPNSVTEIGEEAFYGCSGLTSVVIPNSVTSIGSYAFSGCSGLTSVVIPNSVTSIGSCAFYRCSGLTSVVIPNSVTSIGSCAFYRCSSLTSLVIGNSVTSIGREAFSGCSGLTSVVIPNSVTSIGEKAFSDCSGLTSVTIPNSVTSIGNCAFNGCTSLRSLNIEEGETTLVLGCNTYNSNTSSSVGKGLFYDCPLEELHLGRNIDYSDYSTSSYTWDSHSSCYGYSAFYNKSELTELTIGDKVTEIGEYAFSGCSGLTSVVIPNSVTSIGESAFSGCSGLTSVVIPNSVTSIGETAFFGCSGLTSVVIPNSVTEIGEYAFSGCSGLTSLVIGNSVTSIGWNAFSYCSSLTSVVIPNSVTEIGEEAFYRCSSLTSLVIGNSVTEIGDMAFVGCTNLRNLTFEDGSNTLKLGYNMNYRKGLFYGCPLENVYLGRNISYSTDEEYGYSPFYKINTITELTIGDKVTSIGDYAFCGCYGLWSVKVHWNTPIRSIGFNALDDVAKRADLYVPQGTASKYQTAFFWRDFYSIQEYDDKATAIGSINIDKPQSKAIKTIEDGKIVIIREGVKYDLAGKKMIVK